MKQRGRRFSARAKLWVALGCVVIIIGVLIRTAVTKASTYYLTVPELMQQKTEAVGAETTVLGTIVGSTVSYNPASERLTFTMQDDKGVIKVPVLYHGARPDDFTNNWPVVVSGKLQPNGVFLADQLLIKCPSKYQVKSGSNSSAS